MSDDDPRKRMVEVMLQNQEAFSRGIKDPLDSLLNNPLMTTSTAPSNCPKCDSEMKVTRQAMTGPYGGVVHCDSCGYRDSVVAYLGRQMISIEPLPDGAEPVYTKSTPLDDESQIEKLWNEGEEDE